jgi:Protein of unknown function (DUF4235)
MAKKKKDKQNKPSLAQTIGAMVLGTLAVKLATYVVTTVWRLVTREEPPQVDEAAPIAKKAAWVGIVGAATGAARQAARDYVKPPGAKPG